MYRSPTYAGRKAKSVFLEMSERSAEAARLLQQAREPRPDRRSRRRRASVRHAASQWDHLLQRIGNRMTQRRGEAHG